MTHKKQVIICADDFGQSDAISLGIHELARANRIHAISCMVNVPGWAASAASLKQLTANVLTGLHFNLTYGRPLSHHWRRQYGQTFPSLGQLLSMLLTRRLDAAVIKSECLAQWDAFAEQTGQAPRGVDGHQHVHQYGLLRQVVCEILLEKQYHGACRTSTNGLKDIGARVGFPKPMLMCLLGGRSLNRLLMHHRIQTNTSFAGFYPFKHAASYRRYFRAFLEQSSDGGLIMCHPGLASTDRTDPLYLSRHHELTYLMSDLFIQDLKEFGFENTD